MAVATGCSGARGSSAFALQAFAIDHDIRRLAVGIHRHTVAVPMLLLYTNVALAGSKLLAIKAIRAINLEAAAGAGGHDGYFRHGHGSAAAAASAAATSGEALLRMHGLSSLLFMLCLSSTYGLLTLKMP